MTIEVSSNVWTPERHFTDIISPLLPWISKVELEGVEIDTDKLDELRPKFETMLEEIEVEVEGYAGHEINLNAPKQKSDLIFDELTDEFGNPIPPTKLTPSGGQYSTQKDDLKPLAYLHPAIPLIIQHGSLSTIMSTFVNGIPKQMHPETNRLHPNVNQVQTDTSRFSYSSPNIQNIPVRDDLGLSLIHI